MMRYAVAIFLSLLSSFALGSCLDEAAKSYRIDPLLIKAIRWVESRDNPDAVGPLLSDGNRALGAMQINTILLPELKPYGVQREHLFDECTSLKIGTWALAKCISKFGPTGKAIGCYNTGAFSKNVDAQERYARQVGEVYQQLARNPNHSPNSKLPRTSTVGHNYHQAPPNTGRAISKELKSWGPVDVE